MPKVISRAAISSSSDAPITATQQAILKTYFCLCGEFLLVIDTDVRHLPRRPTDNTIVVRCKASSRPTVSSTGEPAPPVAPRVFKLNSVDGGKQFVKRENDLLEPQHIHLCPRCATPVGYQAAPPPTRNATFLYLYWGGLTEVQGHVPDEAWEGEEELLGDGSA
ncbi:Uncharacterized conserved protein [Phaffia rhodozyma]|uniref:Uncharacterized conserved protein n=1 Tax=Phaffia rhodozyma TaxID=264483 RepID=A0A0F7STJ3_PHARH|nr:Uncharacterized conserved protein [Phaffia rhodozyma]